MLLLLEAEAKERQGRRTDLAATSSSIQDEVAGMPSAGRSTTLAARQLNVGHASVERAKYLKAHHPDV